MKNLKNRNKNETRNHTLPRISRHMDKCNKATKRRLRQRDVEMAAICNNMEFSLYGEEGGNMVEGVANFKYMGQTLDQTNDDWPAVW